MLPMMIKIKMMMMIKMMIKMMMMMIIKMMIKMMMIKFNITKNNLHPFSHKLIAFPIGKISVSFILASISSFYLEY